MERLFFLILLSKFYKQKIQNTVPLTKHFIHMKKQLFKLTVACGLITLCYLPMPLSAQAFAYAQTKQKVEREETLNTQIKLKDAILSLKNQFNVDILFEEKILSGIKVSQENFKSSKDLEKSLDNLLTPNGLTFKKVRKNTYLIIGKKSERIWNCHRTSNPRRSTSIFGRH